MSAKTKKTTEETEPEPKAAKSAAKLLKATAKVAKTPSPEKLSKENVADDGPKKAAPAPEKPSKKDKAPPQAKAQGQQSTPAVPSREGPCGRSVHAKQYRPEDRYKVGDVVYHPVWQEEGTVIEVGKTPGDIDKIVVEFDRLGTKRLVANYSAVTASEND
jgi:hypothetical protein